MFLCQAPAGLGEAAMSLRSPIDKRLAQGYLTPPWSLSRVTNVDGGDPNSNSLWSVTEIQAHSGAKLIGFLQINYIPRARYEKLCPSRLDKIAVSGHHSGLKNLDGADLPALKTALFDGHIILDSWSRANAICDQARTTEQALTLIQTMTNRLWEHPQTRKMLEAYEGFHLDRPMVFKVDLEEAFQRQGIGRAMYREAAQWLGEQDLQLHASEIQTVAAKAIWAELARDSLAQIDTTGSVTRMRMNLPTCVAEPARQTRGRKP
jgi:GNAT superfamily N-acetyltransferase